LICSHAVTVEEAQCLLHENISPDINSLNFGITALHAACQGSKLEVAEFLIHAGANIEAISDDGMNPLHYAILFENIEIAKLLINSSKDPKTYVNIPTLARRSVAHGPRETSLHLACQTKNLELVKFLIRVEADPNLISLDGLNALHYAVQSGNLDTVQFLIESSQTPMDYVHSKVQDDIKNTSLHLAAQYKQFKLIEYLLSVKADIFQANSLGENAIHLCCGVSESESMRYLICQFPKLIDKSTNEGATYLSITAERDQGEDIKWLLEQGANPQIKIAGHTAWEIAHIKGCANAISAFAYLEFKYGTFWSSTFETKSNRYRWFRKDGNDVRNTRK
jgi:ankyrin repeat protein